MKPVLYMVIPCYNEEAVLPVTAPLFLEQLQDMIRAGSISSKSRILFVDDGSRDKTGALIRSLSKEQPLVTGIFLSRNFGHQNALLAGLMEAKTVCDAAITLDCDGQDDVTVIPQMLEEYQKGCQIVYGVRKNRDTDSFSKRTCASLFYKCLNLLNGQTIPEHGDFRLMSRRVIEELSDFQEVNLFLRGMIPMVGFSSTAIYYERKERFAGNTHYPLRRQLSLAANGITSLSIRPLHMIAGFGFLMAFFSFIGILWSVIQYFRGLTVWGWASTTCIICLVSGIQLICLGVLGEYIGKIYLEVKHRPRYIIDSRTEHTEENNE